MHPVIEQHRTELRALAARYGVADVRVFGPTARGDATDASDFDLLVRPLAGTSLLNLGGIDLETGWTVVENGLDPLQAGPVRLRDRPEPSP